MKAVILLLLSIAVATTSEKTCRCQVSGDPHYKTFDGQMIHFMGTCKYILSQSVEYGQYFSIEVKNEHRGRNTRVSYTRLVDVNFKGLTVRINPQGRVEVNGSAVTLPFRQSVGNFSVNVASSPGWVTVTTGWDLKVRFDGKHRVEVFVPGIYRKHLTGLCGDCNGIKDDYKTKGGKDVSRVNNKFSIIGESYRVRDDSNFKQCEEKEDIKSHCDLGKRKCNLLRSLFASCAGKLTKQIFDSYYEDCVFDVCAYATAPTLSKVWCQAVEGLSAACEIHGINVNWRARAKCPKECGKNMVYKYKTSACQSTCSSLQTECDLPDVEGCVCKPGFVLSGEECIAKRDCGCSYSKNGYNIYIPLGTHILLPGCKYVAHCKLASGRGSLKYVQHSCGSNQVCGSVKGQRGCECAKGYVLVGSKCVLKKTCRCQVSGDPHYKTFDGQMIHFMGTCKYILSQSVEYGQYFSIEVKNEHRGRNTRVSYTRLVDVNFKGLTVRINPQGRVELNGSAVTLPFRQSVGNFSVNVASSPGWVTVTTGWDLKVRFDGKHRVEVFVPGIYRKHLTGLCGDCNGIKDDYKTKGGKDVSRVNNKFSIIGESYRVRDDSNFKQCEEKEDIKSHCDLGKRKCNLLRSLFASCAGKLTKQIFDSYYEDCVFDVCAYATAPTLSKVWCQAVEGLSAACEIHGINVNWRARAKCPKECGKNMVYKYKTSACQSTCSSLQTECDLPEVEGCVCKPGFVLSGEECIAKRDCGCSYSKNGYNIYIPLGTHILLPGCKYVANCKLASGRGSLKYVQHSCGSNQVCGSVKGQRGCECAKGYVLVGSKCVLKKTCRCQVSGDPHYKTFDGQMIHFMGTCKYILSQSVEYGQYFSIEVKNEHRGRNTRVSYTRLVDVNFKGLTVRINPQGRVEVNGSAVTLPFRQSVGNFSVNVASSPGWVTVTTGWDLKVRFDGKHRVEVFVPGIYRKHLTGLCGDCNGIKDDYKTKGGKDVSRVNNKFSIIGESYRVRDDSNFKQCEEKEDIKSHCDLGKRKCNLLRSLFASCAGKLTKQIFDSYYEDCVFDVCAYATAPTLSKVWCQAVEGLSAACEIHGINVNWRARAKCPKECGKNMVYKYKTSACQSTCSSLQTECDLPDVEGCVCKPGFVLSGEECIAKRDCGCSYSKNGYNIYIPLGTHILLPGCKYVAHCKLASGRGSLKYVQHSCGSNQVCGSVKGQRGCECAKGYVLVGSKCVLKKTCRCQVSGDPHYKTFDGQMIHFMGTCKYILSQSVEYGQYFSIEVKNEHRGRNTRVSYTRLVDVNFKGLTVRINPQGRVEVNGSAVTLPFRQSVGNFSVNVASSPGWVTVTTGWDLKVRFDGKHRVEVFVPGIYRKHLTGICGDCNGIKDDYKTKGGKDVSRVNNKFSIIGESYRVRDDSNFKQCEEKEDIKSHCDLGKRKCNLLRSLFASCAGKLTKQIFDSYYEDCVFDVCAYATAPTLSKVWCQAVEGLSAACEIHGINVNWRARAKCPKECGKNMVYKYKTSACQSTCSSLQTECNLPEVEGCVCKPGFVLSGEECIAKRDCGCTYSRNGYNIYIPLGQNIVLPGCQSVVSCVADVNGRGTLKTDSLKCDHGCGILDGRRQCLCPKGYSLEGHKCIKNIVCIQTTKDTVFTVDRSGSIGPDSMKQIRDFLKIFINATDVSETNVRISVVTINRIAELNDYLDKEQEIKAIPKMQNSKGRTRRGEALEFV